MLHMQFCREVTLAQEEGKSKSSSHFYSNLEVCNCAQGRSSDSLNQKLKPTNLDVKSLLKMSDKHEANKNLQKEMYPLHFDDTQHT